jgi:hypothetical protein
MESRPHVTEPMTVEGTQTLVPRWNLRNSEFREQRETVHQFDTGPEK